MEQSIILFFNSFPKNFMFLPRFFSVFGSLMFLLALMPLLYYFEEKLKSLLLLIGTIITSAITLFIKMLIKRSRPFLVIEGVSKYIDTASYSFPSGHAALAFLLATVLDSDRKYLYVVASLAALSRVVLGVHYLTDVVGGSILGHLIGVFVLRYRKRISNFLTKSELI